MKWSQSQPLKLEIKCENNMNKKRKRKIWWGDEISKSLKEKGIKPPSRKGKKWSLEEKKEISKRLKKRYKDYPLLGKQISEKLKNKRKPESFGKKISKALKGKRNSWAKPPHFRREKHWNWKGGITPLVSQIRRCFKYYQWRRDVFTRDDFTCQRCGTKGGWIEADHYPKKFSDIFHENKIKTLGEALNCKELWNINNGRTLCKKCHNKIKDGRKVGWGIREIRLDEEVESISATKIRDNLDYWKYQIWQDNAC